LTWPLGIVIVSLVTIEREAMNSEHQSALTYTARSARRLFAALFAGAYILTLIDLYAAGKLGRDCREIHDGLGHYLTTIHMQIQAARSILNTDRPRAEQTLAKAQQLAHEALGDVRRSVAALRVAPADRVSLPEALAELAEAAQAAGLPTKVAVVGDMRPLDPPEEQTLYRAAQEGLTNARKHAQATGATLTLDFADAKLVRLTVADDGRGASTTDGGFGLIGLRERVQLVGGSLTLRTAPGAGLALIVEVPA
jgi:signal transduction histidine kinase